MPGNLRRRSSTRPGRTERDYLRARRRVLRESQICVGCRQAVDLNLKPICQFVNTDGYTAETAHLIPLTCGDECVGHARKANPWSASANHKIPVASLPPDSPLLTDPKNLETMHLKCNRDLGDRGEVRPRTKTSRDWFA